MTMELNADKILEEALRDGLREGVSSKLKASYNNPLDKLIDAAIQKRASEFTAILNDALQSCIGDAQFREDIKTSVRHTLAKILVQRFGGELEKSVNALKSDPTTRARITVAIEDIVKQKTL